MADMSPWDAFSWFDTPRERSVSIGFGAVTVVAAAEPRRVVLILTSPQADLTVSLNPDVAQGKGIRLNTQSGQLPFVVTQQQMGPLAQLQWYGFSSAGGTCTVIEVLLRDWPAERAATPNAQLQATLALTRATEELTRALRQR